MTKGLSFCIHSIHWGKRQTEVWKDRTLLSLLNLDVTVPGETFSLDNAGDMRHLQPVTCNFHTLIRTADLKDMWSVATVIIVLIWQQSCRKKQIFSGIWRDTSRKFHYVVTISLQQTSSYLGDRSEEPSTCSSGWASGASPSPSVPSTVLSSSNSEVLLSPKSSKCSSSPPMTVTREWLWSSEFRENLRHTRQRHSDDCLFTCLHDTCGYLRWSLQECFSWCSRLSVFSLLFCKWMGSGGYIWYFFYYHFYYFKK